MRLIAGSLYVGKRGHLLRIKLARQNDSRRVGGSRKKNRSVRSIERRRCVYYML